MLLLCNQTILCRTSNTTELRAVQISDPAILPCNITDNSDFNHNMSHHYMFALNPHSLNSVYYLLNNQKYGMYPNMYHPSPKQN